MTAHNDSHYVFLYDTTLRDGAQTRGVDFSVKDKINVARKLDALGIDYIEGGWPGANPTDDAFFAAPPSLQARLTAFGMTRRLSDTDGSPQRLDAPNAAALCLVGKSAKRHVREALNLSLEQNLRMIADSIAAGAQSGRETLFDAEHFFDGYKDDRAYALACLSAAHEAGASWIVLCDTNGGTLPHDVYDAVRDVATHSPGMRLGVHMHNDCGCAVANSLEAVRAGCRMVQGTLNGLGERCGNADMTTLIPLLAKLGYTTGVSSERLGLLTRLSREFDVVIDRAPNDAQPFVGARAFAHKGGLHVSAVAKDPALYEHMPPESVGNTREILVSDQAGRSNAALLLRDMGLAVDAKDARLGEIIALIKEREARGYAFGEAPASFALLAMRMLDKDAKACFAIEGFHVSCDVVCAEEPAASVSRASLTVHVNGEATTQTAVGYGPVNALDVALRRALLPFFPELHHVRLSDFHVRIIDTQAATAATTRVCIEMEDTRNGNAWRTTGVSENIVQASAEALRDGYDFRLSRIDAEK